MRYFLTLLLLSSSFSVFAQSSEETPLFPELNVIKSEDTEISEENGELTEENAQESSVISDDTGIEEEVSSSDEISEEEGILADEEKIEEEEEKETPQYIFWTVDDVQATLAPNRNGSFCSLAFLVSNQTKKKLEKFSGTFTIGEMQKKFNFSGVNKGESVVSRYTFVGTSCEKILDPPEINIQKCKMENWSEKKCKSKVKFVSLPNSENSLE